MGFFINQLKILTFLSERQKNFLSLKTIKFLNIITIVENNALGLALKGCGIAAPCRSLIAKQVLEFGVKAGITGIVAKRSQTRYRKTILIICYADNDGGEDQSESFLFP